MNYIKGRFANRTIGFYIGVLVAVVMLIADVAFTFVGKSGDRTFHNITFVFILLGVLSEVLVILTDFVIAPLICVIFYSVALGKHLYQAAFPLADYFTGVKFFGGNVTLAVGFGAVFFICTLAMVVSCFMNQRKTITV
ncbi:MAG: Uncharacterized protein K0R92_1308 [Lachnospiraceae bacterium]|jgi:hypothetical protein|nr:Uncharacterized protein [Lachnospiraceae bacterium]